MEKVKYYFPHIQVKCITGYVRKGETATIVSRDGAGADHRCIIEYSNGEKDIARIDRINQIYDLEFLNEKDEILQTIAEQYKVDEEPVSIKCLYDDQIFHDLKFKYVQWSGNNIIGVVAPTESYTLVDPAIGRAQIIPKTTGLVGRFNLNNLVSLQHPSKFDYVNNHWYCNVPPGKNIITFDGTSHMRAVAETDVRIINKMRREQDGKWWYCVTPKHPDAQCWVIEDALQSGLPSRVEDVFPLEGQCKTITPELEAYLRSTRTPEGDQSQKEKARAICWNHKGYWYVSRSSQKYEYSIEFLSQFFTQKTEQPMATTAQPGQTMATQQFEYSPQGGFQLTLPPEMVASALKTATESHMRESTKTIDLKKRELESFIEDKATHLEKAMNETMERKISCEFVEFKEKVIADHLKSQHVVVKLGDQPKYEFSLTDKHAELPKMISFLQLFKQAMIVGPSGSGKSTMAKQAAEVMGLRYGSFSCNLEASKSELIGFANIDGYVESSFLDFYENGGVFLVDEYDSMSPSIAVVLNAAFDRTGQIAVPNRRGKTIAKKHKDFYCILAGNTWGSGSVEYQGREMQDAAFLDRFKMCRLFIDYDEKLEKNIAGEYYDFFQQVRQYVRNKVDGENFSTRSIYDASVLLQNGFKKKDILMMMSEHWDEALRKDIFKEISVK